MSDMLETLQSLNSAVKVVSEHVKQDALKSRAECEHMLKTLSATDSWLPYTFACEHKHAYENALFCMNRAREFIANATACYAVLEASDSQHELPL